MASTKIINVLKDDKFEEILDLFRDTTAKEVIFVLPKKSKSFKTEEHFMIMGNEAQKEGKTISILCSNPDINDWAKKYKFDILLKHDDKKSQPRVTAVNQLDSINDEDEANPDIYESEYFKDSKLPDEDDELSGLHVEELDEKGESSESPVKIKTFKNDMGDEDENGGDENGEEEETDPEKTDEGETEEKDDYFPSPEGEKIRGDEDGSQDDDTEEEDPDERFEESIEEKIEDGEAEGVSMPEDFSNYSLDENQNFEIRAASVRKNMSDIVSPDGDSKNLKISQKNNKPVSVDVKKSIKPEEAQEIWEKGSIWEDEAGKKSWSSLFKSQKTEPNRYQAIQKPKGTKRLIIGLGIVSVLLLGAIVYTVAGSAKITITPQTKPVDFKMTVSASDKFSSVDSTFNKIPGQLFNVEKSVSKTADATGQKDVAQKARGKITIHNDLTVPQPLVATTRFETADGLIFRTLQTVTVSAGKTLTVDVIADKAGAQYNVPAGKFVVTSFKENNDLSRLSKVYGVSSDAMHGGTSGKSKVVTETDYNNVKDALTQQLKQEIADALKSQSMGLKIINASDPMINNPTSTAQPDEAADNFTMTLTGVLKTIGFKESDLNDLIVKYADKNNDLTVIPEKLEISYSDIKYDDSSNLLEFTVSVKGPGYAKIDGQKIVSDLLGKSDTDIKKYLESAPGVASAKVLLSPFWVKKMPKNEAKITWTVNYQ